MPRTPGMASAAARVGIRVDVGDAAPPGCRTIAAEVVTPQPWSAAEPPPVLFCFAGGGISRHYFDLAVPGYSFAEYACERGFVTVLMDHPGTGDSDVPDDGWSLTPETIARADAAAVDGVLAALKNGEVAGVPPLRPATVIGVGHSMGGLLLIYQQAGFPRFDGLAVLGWCARGLPEYLDESERELSSLDDFEDRLVEGAKRLFGEPLPTQESGTEGLLTKNPIPDDVRRALAEARSRLLAVAGYASLIPRSAARESARIDVPVFLGVGEHDIVTGHHAIPAEFPTSRDVALFVLAGAGHNHNVEPGREELWARIADWADDLTRRAAGKPRSARGQRAAQLDLPAACCIVSTMHQA
jgi:alpha-beta hydrolase superfamily lysophospholipase